MFSMFLTCFVTLLAIVLFEANADVTEADFTEANISKIGSVEWTIDPDGHVDAPTSG